MKTMLSVLVLAFLARPLLAAHGPAPVDVKMDCRPLKEMAPFRFVQYKDRVWSFKGKNGIALGISCDQAAPADREKLLKDLGKLGKLEPVGKDLYKVSAESAGVATVTFYFVGAKISQYAYSVASARKRLLDETPAPALAQ